MKRGCAHNPAHRAVIPALVVLLARVAPALAAGTEHGAEVAHGLDLGTLGLQILNFAVLVLLLTRYGGRALGSLLQKRHDTLKADLAAAEKLYAEAEARLRAQDERLANLQTRLAELQEAARKTAKAERARLVALAEEKAQRLRDETRFLIAQEVKQAEAAFRAELAVTAARVAETLVRQRFGPHDQARLLDAFAGVLDEVALGAAAPTSPPGGVS